MSAHHREPVMIGHVAVMGDNHIIGQTPRGCWSQLLRRAGYSRQSARSFRIPSGFGHSQLPRQIPARASGRGDELGSVASACARSVTVSPDSCSSGGGAVAGV